jgi:CubicO group peptidase (beta-lactamase class C family)
MRAALLAPTLVAVFTACGSAGPNGLAASIARVERRLIPPVRVRGDRRGWSIEERLRAHHTPAVSIAVIYGHRVLWAKAYGQTDVRTGAPADRDTVFQAASISKLVTALAALRLAEAGKLALDADVNQALRGWKLPANELTRRTPVTLRQLLQHTAGTNVRTVFGHPAGAPLPTLAQILDGIPPANTPPVRVEGPPGEKFRYSGGGSLIVQQLVVDVTGRPFADAMAELVFAPLGLAHTTFEVPPPAAFSTRAATPHDHDHSILPPLVYPEAAPAGLWSTPSDLARVLVEIQLGLAGRSRLVSRELAAGMTTPVAPVGQPGVSVGMGTFVERHGDALYFGHDGWNDGFLSVARASTSGGYGAVVMANGAGAAPLILEILRSIAVEYDWKGWLKPPLAPARVAPARLHAWAGRYRAGADTSVRLVVRGDRLQAEAPFRAPLELIPLGDDTFVGRENETRFVFRRDAAGREQLVITPSDEEPTVLSRADDDALEPLRLVEAGREEEALAGYRALRAAHPEDPALAESRFDELAAELLDRRGEIEPALRLFRVEAALYPDSPSAIAGLALAYLRAGRGGEAGPLVARAEALRAGGKPRSEVEEIYLGIRMSRVKRLAAR